MDLFRLFGLIVWNLFAVFGVWVFFAAIAKLAARK